ncbi:MAG: glycosyltransferase family 4 protein [Anaerolineales bacterium]|nr:glycosyltransferase family 4 protein [Anaerolineales bacterium]
MKEKILLIGPILKTYGGVSRFQEDLLNSGMNYQFVHFNTARPPKMRSTPIANGYEELFNSGLVRTFTSILITIWHVLKLPYVLFRESPQIVHIASVTYWVFWESAAYLLISKILGCKTIFHMLGPFDVFYLKSGENTKLLIHKILQKADKVICLSDRDRDLMSNFLVPKNILVFRSNARLSLDKVVSQNRKGRERVEILFIGGVEPFRKGIYDILKALPIVINKFKEVRFTFTGGQNTEQALHDALDPNFASWVSFRGWVSELEKWDIYQASDLLLLPSYEEGLPYVLIEAMAYGLPIITTPVGGIPEVVRDGTNGILITPGDYEALANAIVHLVQNEQLRLLMGNNNREDAKKYYSQEIIFNELEAAYSSLIENSLSIMK